VPIRKKANGMGRDAGGHGKIPTLAPPFRPLFFPSNQMSLTALILEDLWQAGCL
jgi:hypothetical protein